MTQDLEELVGRRIRGLRTARGWSLDALAGRCALSPSTLSRIETGHRRVALDQLVRIAGALAVTLDQLLAPSDVDDADVVIRPEPSSGDGRTTWVLTRDTGALGTTVAKVRITEQRADGREPAVHPGHHWLTVLSGVAKLLLGERTVLVRAGEAAQFPTMTPHLLLAHGGPVEILTIFDQQGRGCQDEGGPPR